ncbi:MAG: hypothetical protein CUN57_02235, partial [Phototrophicales bacterium]
IYTGEWHNNVYVKRGKITYPNGDVYDGEWMGGRRNGKGIFRSAMYTYTGHWKNNAMHGTGKMKMKSGDSYTGHWRNNLPNGTGKFKYKNGDVLQGQWTDGQPTGKMLLTSAEKQHQTVMIWKNGLQNVPGVFLFPFSFSVYP